METQLSAREKPGEMALTLTPSSPSLLSLILKSKDSPDTQIALYKAQSSMTVAGALAVPHQLSGLRKADEESLINAMCILLTGLAKSVNVGKNLDTLQTYETATLLIEKYWYLRLEEFVYVFKRAKLGKYGQLFDRLDVTVISGWVDA